MSKNLSLDVMVSYITKRLDEFDPFSNALSFDTNGFGMELYCKYYFIPDHNYDGIFLSPYIRYRNISGPSTSNNLNMENKRFAMGLSGGYKYMLTERLSLELMLGIGYAISNKFDYTPTLTREPDFAFTNVDVIIRLPFAFRF